ncbi:hypothetical protein HB662_00745 [Roseomonas frigidaquae]|uniref:DUF6468 domain-containing protein n=1 Tax=Falsiroseomonas frigidaquae TaxID=487318 RepID=A0ABX1ERP0_9PROT|nr:DUF6468 domain-containing protein [Falsiroseomonas frigidaquae]NKE43285.1 hypothetical protein [Falsiroseomonas frigidaquae]
MTIADLPFDLLRWLIEALLLLIILGALPSVIRLDRALSAMRRDRGALAESTRHFAEATRDAELVIARLRAAADGAGRGLGDQLRNATALREDLRFLSERAEKLADRMEAGLRAPPPESAPPAPPTLPRARAETELMRALSRRRSA